MTKEEVLKELDALNELTNSMGRAMIVNIRAWVNAVADEKPMEFIYKEEAPVVEVPPVTTVNVGGLKPSKPKPFRTKNTVKKPLKRR